MEQLWGNLPWYHKKALVLAVIVIKHVKVITGMGKVRVAYLLAVMLLVAVTGAVIAIVQNNALMGVAFGAMLAGTIVGGLAFLVWYYFH